MYPQGASHLDFAYTLLDILKQAIGKRIRDPGWCDDEKRNPSFARWSKERHEFRGCSRGKSKLTEIGPIWNMDVTVCTCMCVVLFCFTFCGAFEMCKCWSRDETIFHQTIGQGVGGGNHPGAHKGGGVFMRETINYHRKPDIGSICLVMQIPSKY